MKNINLYFFGKYVSVDYFTATVGPINELLTLHASCTQTLGARTPPCAREKMAVVTTIPTKGWNPEGSSRSLAWCWLGDPAIQSLPSFVCNFTF